MKKPCFSRKSWTTWTPDNQFWVFDLLEKWLGAKRSFTKQKPRAEPDAIHKILFNALCSHLRLREELDETTAELSTAWTKIIHLQNDQNILKKELKSCKDSKHQAEQKLAHFQSSASPLLDQKDPLKNIQTIFESGIGAPPEKQISIPSLEQALQILQALYPNHVHICDNAFESAKESSDFENPTKAFYLMLRLVTEYRSRMMKGGGNATAKAVFSDKECSWDETDNVDDHLRTFEGRRMAAHLRIGKGRSTTNGWRCHFIYDPDSQKIWIGHCGKHLNFS